MDVDEEVQLSKPKAPTKPAPEDVSLTHKTPAEITPTVGIHRHCSYSYNDHI